MLKEKLQYSYFRAFLLIALFNLVSFSSFADAFDQEVEADIAALNISTKSDIFFQSPRFIAEEINKRKLIEELSQNQKKDLLLIDQKMIVLVPVGTSLYSLKNKNWFKSPKKFWATGIVKKENPKIIYFSKKNKLLFYTLLTNVTSLEDDLNIYQNQIEQGYRHTKGIQYPKINLSLIPEISFGISTFSSSFFQDVFKSNAIGVIAQTFETSISFKSQNFPLGVRLGFIYEQFNFDTVGVISLPLNIGLSYQLPFGKKINFYLLASKSIISNANTSIERVSLQFEGVKFSIQKNWKKYSLNLWIENRFWAINSTDLTIINQSSNKNIADQIIGAKISYIFNNLL